MPLSARICSRLDFTFSDVAVLLFVASYLSDVTDQRHSDLDENVKQFYDHFVSKKNISHDFFLCI